MLRFSQQVHRTSELPRDGWLSAVDGMRSSETVVCVIGTLTGALYVLVRLTARGLWNHGTPVTDTARAAWLAAGYAGGTVLLFGLYVLILGLARTGALRTQPSKTLVLAFPVLFNIGLIFDLPALSVDLFTYLALGYIGTLPGGNPYVQFAMSVGDTPFGQQLVALGWHAAQGPSPYGPVWNELATAVVAVAHDALPAMLLMKTLLVCASLASAVLIWFILARVDPGTEMVGTLAYLWNPLVIVEVAGEGHNDALLVLTVLAGLAAAVRMRPGVALVALVLGTLCKYVPLIFLPAQLVYFWRAARDRPWRLPIQLVLGIVLALVIVVIAFAPVWVGTAMFESAIHVALSSPASSSEPPSPPLLSVLRLGAFGVFMLVASWRVTTTASLLATCGAIALLYAAVGSALYWPWYGILPVALLALSPRRSQWVILALSGCAQLQAPGLLFVQDGLTTNAVITWTSRVARAFPVLLYVVLSPLGRSMMWHVHPQARARLGGSVHGPAESQSVADQADVGAGA